MLIFYLSLLQDCFRDAARELAESPEVGIIQHESGIIHSSPATVDA
jgi:hypothetical protein